MITLLPEIYESMMTHIRAQAGNDWLKYWMREKWVHALAFQTQTEHS